MSAQYRLDYSVEKTAQRRINKSKTALWGIPGPVLFNSEAMFVKRKKGNSYRFRGDTQYGALTCSSGARNASCG